jgi:hypothetical protein
MESQLGVLGIARKLVKDVVQLWRWNFEINKIFSFLHAATQKTTTFGFQRILGVKLYLLAQILDRLLKG